MYERDSDLYEAFWHGYQAYQNGATRDNNPYDNNGMWEYHRAWDEGYYQAAEDD